MDQTCEDHLDIEQNVTVGERMVGFRERVHFKVYNKDKPSKFGIKLWMLCDPSSHYINKFQVYLGKVGTWSEHEQGERVALNLTGTLAKQTDLRGAGEATLRVDLQMALCKDCLFRNK